MELIFVMMVCVFIVFFAAIGYYMVWPKVEHDYWCHTDNIQPDQSHGHAEPHV